MYRIKIVATFVLAALFLAVLPGSAEGPKRRTLTFGIAGGGKALPEGTAGRILNVTGRVVKDAGRYWLEVQRGRLKGQTLCLLETSRLAKLLAAARMGKRTSSAFPMRVRGKIEVFDGRTFLLVRGHKQIKAAGKKMKGSSKAKKRKGKKVRSKKGSRRTRTKGKKKRAPKKTRRRAEVESNEEE